MTNDILEVDICEEHQRLRARFEKEPLFAQVIDAIFGIQNKSTSICDKRRAHHRAEQYLIEEGKLWRLRGGARVRGRTKVECVTREEARALADKQHREQGHFGRDSIKMNLLDRICSPGLDATILDVIKDCGHCKNFRMRHINALLEPITR